jgi:branched-subunit amino acid transport protein
MDQKEIALTIVGMAAVTYVPRVLPALMLAARSLPALVTDWLRYVPAAVLAAMLAVSLTVSDGRVDLDASKLFLWAALPTFLTAWKTRSLFGSVIVGMAIVAAARYLLGT